jgi:hypothetical protein
MPTQRRVNAAQVSKGSFNASEMQHKLSKAVQFQANKSNSSQRKQFKSEKAFQVSECSFKAAHAG